MKPLYGILILTGSNKLVGTGWLPPKPDLRDYTSDQKEIKALNKMLGISQSKPAATTVDLRQWCSPVEDQESLGSCTAQAGIGIVEYYERRAFNKYIEGSRLFLYKVSRNHMQVEGDIGAWLRDTAEFLPKNTGRMSYLNLIKSPMHSFIPWQIIMKLLNTSVMIRREQIFLTLKY